MDLVLKNLKLVNSILRKSSFTKDFDDSFQDGALALIYCDRGFNPNLGFKFSTYAWPSIKRKIYRGVEKRKRIISVPVAFHSKYFGLNPQIPNHEASNVEKEEFKVICAVNLTFRFEEFKNVIDNRESAVDKTEILDLLNVLDRKEMLVIKYRFFRKLTYRQIGPRMDMSHENVRLIEKRALKKLRKEYL